MKNLHKIIIIILIVIVPLLFIKYINIGPELKNIIQIEITKIIPHTDIKIERNKETILVKDSSSIDKFSNIINKYRILQLPRLSNKYPAGDNKYFYYISIDHESNRNLEQVNVQIRSSDYSITVDDNYGFTFFKNGNLFNEIDEFFNKRN